MPREGSDAKKVWMVVWILGGIFAVIVSVAFFKAAPTMPVDLDHRPEAESIECLGCHIRRDKGTPIMPHRDLGNCSFCHAD